MVAQGMGFLRWLIDLDQRSIETGRLKAAAV
jgi:hypothetical protein